MGRNEACWKILTIFIIFTPLFGSALTIPKEPTPLEKQDDLDSPQQSLEERFADVISAGGEEKQDSGQLHMGDSIITTKQATWVYGPPQAAVPDESLRWTDAIIPYVIDCSLENLKDAVDAINAAMQEWESKTCIKFVKRTNEKKFLKFFRSTHCWAYVGMVQGSALSVGYGCEYNYVMAHELGHVIGFFHEQNRNDRDDWVNVKWRNIGQFTSAFEKATNGIYHGTSYDYSSIMHYPWSAFSSNGRNTLEPRRRRTKTKPYESVSPLDIEQTSKMYKCPAIEEKRRSDIGAIHSLIRDEQTAPALLRSPPDNPTQSEISLFQIMNANQMAPTRASVGTEGCVDWSDNCGDWSNAGFCNTYAIVREYCKETCNDRSCQVGCQTVDAYPVCGSFADEGFCCNTVYKSFMKTYCCQTCKARGGKPKRKTTTTTTTTTTTAAPKTTTTTTTTTTTERPPTPEKKSDRIYLGTGRLCVDVKSRCAEWARNGKCEENKRYMFKYCMKSCNSQDCDEPRLKPDGECTEPLGLSWDGTSNFFVPDSAFTSSLGHLAPGGGWTASAKNARLYFPDDYKNKRIGGWCSPTSKVTPNSLQYITVDLGSKKRITHIATQGRDKFFERVSQFKVEYSDDGVNFQRYKQLDVEKTFEGNCDHVTPVLNQFTERLEARYFRYIPWKWNYPCVRMELYGCGLDDRQPAPIMAWLPMADPGQMCE